MLSICISARSIGDSSYMFGGGNAAAVVGDTEVKILQTSRIYNNIYGGNQGEVTGDTKVIVNGTVTTT